MPNGRNFECACRPARSRTWAWVCDPATPRRRRRVAQPRPRMQSRIRSSGSARLPPGRLARHCSTTSSATFPRRTPEFSRERALPAHRLQFLVRLADGGQCAGATWSWAGRCPATEAEPARLGRRARREARAGRGLPARRAPRTAGAILRRRWSGGSRSAELSASVRPRARRRHRRRGRRDALDEHDATIATARSSPPARDHAT